MTLSGVETVFAETENVQYGVATVVRPYHYFEFWLAVGGKLISRQSGLLVYTLFLIPLLGAILLFQAYLFCHSRIKTNWFLSFLAPILIFFTLRYSYLDEWLFILLRDQLQINSKIYKAAFFQNYGFWHFFSYLHGLKLIITGIFFFPFIGFLLSNDEKNYLKHLTLLPLVSLTYIPVTVVFLGLNTLKRVVAKRFSIHSLWPVCSMLFVYLFYSIFSEKVSNDGFHLFTLVEKSILYLLSNISTEIFKLVSDYFENYYWILVILLILITAVYKQWNVYAIAILFTVGNLAINLM